mgnify:CR=1 FL=1
MDTARRIKLIRMIEKIEKNPKKLYFSLDV